ncbi:hypothetical protein HaGV_gp022 [Helicoverpa armigera granulovirus]|uniref:J domain-containing protein n=1 Tax=Helicoverpa armigera granulovirus TaxID=489830 RepID=A9YML4_9BBAC|nr:hypothetical protein HaGV_gp022 [Helicoverpa armigera granulovirus]ABY47713.1 unknown [Helicoverpa armigera granulovirus]
MQDPPLQNINHIKKCYKYLLKIDEVDLKQKGIGHLRNTQNMFVFLNMFKTKIGELVQQVLTLERAVNTRIIAYTKINRAYIQQQVKFFGMVLYLYNKKSRMAIRPDKSFAYSDTYKHCQNGKYYTIKFVCDDSKFYKYACKTTKPKYLSVLDHLGTDHKAYSTSEEEPDFEKEPDFFTEFKNFYNKYKSYFSSSSNTSGTNSSSNTSTSDTTGQTFFDSQSFDFGNIFSSSSTSDANDLFPKRSGGQYSFTKPSVPFPSYKFCYGFEQESHYSALTDNQHLFDKEDLQFIQHSVDDNQTYTKPQLRRLLLKYHPDKNPVYSKVSAVLINKCRNMLKKCIVM